MSKNKWNFDQNAIDQAADFLGLKYPVKISGKRGRKGRSTGLYHGLFNYDTARHSFARFDQYTHVITVSRWVSPEHASEIIWHELTHAAQVENFVEENAGDPEQGHDAFAIAYEEAGGGRINSRKGRKAYNENAFEVEARLAEKNAESKPLVKLTRYGKEIKARRELLAKLDSAITVA